MEIDITIFIDRSLDLQITKRVRQGQTIGDLRALLAADDPTGEATPESIGLAKVSPGANPLTLEALPDNEPITAELTLEVFTPEDSEAAVPVPASSSAGPGAAAPVQTSTAAAAAAPVAANTAPALAAPASASAAAKTQAGESASAAPASPSGYPTSQVDQPAAGKPASASSPAKAKVAQAKLSAADLQSLLKRAQAALAADADFDAANAVLGALAKTIRMDSASRPQLLLHRGLLFWRWSKFDRALSDLTAAHRMNLADALRPLLALNMCLRRYPEAYELAAGSQEAREFIDGNMQRARGANGVFQPSSGKFEPRPFEVMPGIRLVDVKVQVEHGAEEVHLGCRFFLQIRAGTGTPMHKKPMLIYFHGNAETVDTYKDPAAFKAIGDAGASAFIIDFRGYGFSTGTPSMSDVLSDAERVCDQLPTIFAEKSLPWPWPGKLFLFGRSLGTAIACHLAAVKPDLFDGGMVLESAFCGSHAPGAEDPPEPPSDGNPMGGGSGKKFASNPEEIASFGRVVQGLAAEALPGGKDGADALAHFVHLLGNEDLIRGYDGRLLILHGGIDTMIPSGHAERICKAAEASMRKLVIIGQSGHNDLSYTEKYQQALKTFLTAK